MTLEQQVTAKRGELYELATQQRDALNRFQETGVEEPENEAKRDKAINDLELQIQKLNDQITKRDANNARLAKLEQPTSNPFPGSAAGNKQQAREVEIYSRYLRNERLTAEEIRTFQVGVD